MKISHIIFLSDIMVFMEISHDEFDTLIKESLSEIPEEFKEKMDNIVICAEDYPTGDLLHKYGKRNLLGVFIGVPMTKQYWELSYSPHRVILFRENIKSICNTNEQIKQEIRTTLIHEIGHYFGFEEEELRRLQGLPPEPK